MPWPAGRAPDDWKKNGALEAYLKEILAWLEGPPMPTGWTARLVDRDGQGWVRVEQPTAFITATPSRFSAAVWEAAAPQVREMDLELVAPGIFEGKIGKRDGEAASITVRDDAGSVAYLAVPGLPPREYERFGTDRERLEAIVQAGGGQIHQTPASLTETMKRLETRRWVPVGVYLLWSAAAVVAGLVAGRLAGRW